MSSNSQQSSRYFSRLIIVVSLFSAGANTPSTYQEEPFLEVPTYPFQNSWVGSFVPRFLSPFFGQSFISATHFPR